MFLFFLKTLLYGWIIALRDLCRLVRQIICRKGVRKKPSPHRCVPINDPAFVRPDPMIYDQYYLTDLGLAVTWDNPDIQLYLNGSAVSSDLLLPGTTYEVIAQIWNNSTDAPVVELPVAFSFLEFGVGTVSVPLGSTSIDLGVKGGANCPAYASMFWTTPGTPGHYCLQVELQPADDTNPRNNLGQENTNVGTAHSPAVFTFTLRNNTPQRQSYRFEWDAYVPGAPDPCGPSNSAADREARLARHRRGARPLPPGWDVMVSPQSPTLDPGDSISATVTVSPPPGSQVLHCEFEGNGMYVMFHTAQVALFAAFAAFFVCVVIPGLGWLVALLALLGLLLLGVAGGLVVAFGGGEPSDVNPNIGELHTNDANHTGADTLVVMGHWVCDGGHVHDYHDLIYELHPVTFCCKTSPVTNCDPNQVILLKARWQDAVGNASSPVTLENQTLPQNQWQIHPIIDGCQPVIIV